MIDGKLKIFSNQPKRKRTLNLKEIKKKDEDLSFECVIVSARLEDAILFSYFTSK